MLLFFVNPRLLVTLPVVVPAEERLLGLTRSRNSTGYVPLLVSDERAWQAHFGRCSDAPTPWSRRSCPSRGSRLGSQAVEEGVCRARPYLSSEFALCSLPVGAQTTPARGSQRGNGSPKLGAGLGLVGPFGITFSKALEFIALSREDAVALIAHPLA